MIKNFKLIPTTLFLITYTLTPSVTNKQEESYHSHSQLRSLASRYHLDNSEPIYPINNHWFITKKYPKSMISKIHEEILIHNLKISWFNVESQIQQQLTVSEYIEHPSLDIALIQVKEKILTSYIKLIDKKFSIDTNNWVLISGSIYSPSIHTENTIQVLKTGNHETTLAAFSTISKIKNNQLTLSLRDNQYFYPWAYPLYKERQAHRNLKNDNITPQLSPVEQVNFFQQQIKKSFSLDLIFTGLPEKSDIGGLFLLTNNPIEKLDSMFSNQYQLFLIGLIVPTEKNDGTIGKAINLADVETQAWIHETILESEINNYGFSDSETTISNTDGEDLNENNTDLNQIKSIPHSPNITILKRSQDGYNHIQTRYL